MEGGGTFSLRSLLEGGKVSRGTSGTNPTGMFSCCNNLRIRPRLGAVSVRVQLGQVVVRFSVYYPISDVLADTSSVHDTVPEQNKK